MESSNYNVDIRFLVDHLFHPLGVSIADVKTMDESVDYDAHTFRANSHLVIFRKAKITPKKIGQFVTIWKRNLGKITVPYDIKDDFSCLMILVEREAKVGIFIFPKSILHLHNIISDITSDGKRGFRVYPTWDLPTNKQALSSQIWQSVFFIDLSSAKIYDHPKAKFLLSYLQ